MIVASSPLNCYCRAHHKNDKIILYESVSFLYILKIYNTYVYRRYQHSSSPNNNTNNNITMRQRPYLAACVFLSTNVDMMCRCVPFPYIYTYFTYQTHAYVSFSSFLNYASRCCYIVVVILHIIPS